MKIPKTTQNKPYIEFTFNEKGKMKLSATSNWWGGKKKAFFCSNGTEGNTCKPEDLESYIKAFKTKKIKEIESEIIKLQKQLTRFTTQHNT